MKRAYLLPIIDCTHFDLSDILTESAFYQSSGQGDVIRFGDLITEDDRIIGQ